MRKRLFIAIFAAAVAFCVLSFVDIVVARAVLPGFDADGNEIFINRTYRYSIYELLYAHGEIGSAAMFVLSGAGYALTAVGCAVGIYLCAVPRGRRISKAFSGACISLFISIGLSVLMFLVCLVAAFALTPCY